ncbi:substrate-binding periplasmic protein [Spirobacillus cienkowskii]|uniref:substrate-binding periplasmic protein n=1 Tax=Spirobacillus cienkowskii TaxID=495820 RepID=UPI0030D563FE
MRRFLSKFFLISIAIILNLTAHSDDKKTIKFETDIWCPYTCDEKTTQLKGYVIDMAEEIFAKHNIKFTHSLIPWARAIKRAEKGEVDAVGAAYKEGREGYLVFPKEEFAMSINKFYVLKENNWMYKNPESLNNTILGIVLGYVYGGGVGILNQNSKKIMPSGGENAFERNLDKLIRKEINATIEESYVAQYTIKQLKLQDKVKEAGSFGVKKGIYIGFSKALPDSERYAQMLSDGIKELKKNGRFEKILKKYNLKVEK